jgi:hypothetical protein
LPGLRWVFFSDPKVAAAYFERDHLPPLAFKITRRVLGLEE